MSLGYPGLWIHSYSGTFNGADGTRTGTSDTHDQETKGQSFHFIQENKNMYEKYIE